MNGPARCRASITALLFAAIASALPAAVLAGALDLNAKGRSDTDKDRDSYNKPSELLTFWGIKDGMTVMDLHPGNGYLTLLLSQAVGPRGKVVAFASYEHEDFQKRFKDLGLSNVEEVPMGYPECFEDALIRALQNLPAKSFDAVLTIRTYHDLRRPAEVLAELKRILKRGGILGVIDSRTTSGRDEPNHRIAEDVIIREVQTAGFQLAALSNMLSNPKDDYARTYWDARWIVDQSCLRFTR